MKKEYVTFNVFNVMVLCFTAASITLSKELCFGTF